MIIQKFKAWDLGWMATSPSQNVSHPMISENVESDTWFVILNTSDEHIKFRVSANLTTYVADLIRMSICSRFSNTPLVGSISSALHADIEVRVKTFPLDVRLPVQPVLSSSKYLLDPGGFTFGTLSITPKLLKKNRSYLQAR
jgi:hypothetical protein